MRLKPHSLQNKFLSGLGLVMAGVVVFFAVTLNLHLQRLMEGEAREKASLILSQVEAVQHYVRTQLRPAMYRMLPESQFVMEAMSTSYVTRAVMSDLNLAKDSFTYRRVGIGARNPDYEANELERVLVNRFENDPQLVRIEEFVDIAGQQHFITARPQRFEANCMHCHGDPEEAPKELITLYGAERGFGRKVGGLAGIDLVRLKVERDVSGIRDATLSFATFFAVGILVLFLVIQGFFHRLVVQSLRRVTGVMHRLFPDEASVTGPAYPSPAPSTPDGERENAKQEDEIEGILHGFEAFAEHLRQARQNLKDYAATLEDKVSARTVELTQQAEERRADVALFVSLLNTLNESQAKPQLLRSALALIARRFGAARAAYVCVLSATDFAAWPDPTARPELPDDWHDLVSTEEPRFTPRAWYIPVQTTGTSRGILCLFWDAEQEASERQADLAQAIGQQLGIAMENLDALDGLLRQNETLSSIFEGIADPLMLLDAGGAVLLANTTAQRLAAELAQIEGGQPPLAVLIERAALSDGAGEFELPDGRIFEASLYPLESPGGRRSIAYLCEVTAQRCMEGRMRQNERLVAVGQLAAGLAHEINNPLGVIQCYAELLRAAEERPQAQTDLGIIMRHTEQARTVVRDLLNFARPRPAAPGPTDMAAQATALIEVLRPRARAVRAELSLVAAPSLPMVNAGADALEHILSNILLNALDAVADLLEGAVRRVEVALWAAEGVVTATVADTGPGIAPEHLDRVFDPFFTTKDVGKGTGLGLAVVYGLVRELGGTLAVENSPKGGAMFTVRLPVATPADKNEKEF